MRSDASARERTVAERLPVTRGMVALAWGLVSFFGFIAAFMVFVWPISELEQRYLVPHAAASGLWAFAWVLSSGLLALAGARLVFGVWCQVRPAAWMVLLVGALISGAQDGTLANWAIARFGYFDPEFVGPTAFLFVAVAVVAVAGFGVQVGPRWAIWVPMVALAGGVALAIFILAENIPGLADGLGADSGPLAAVTVAAAVYIGAVGILSLARLRRG